MGNEVIRTLASILSGYKKEKGEEKGERERNLVTLNLLGGGGGGSIGVGSGDLDLDFRVSPPGLGNNRCDLLSDKMQPRKPSPAPARRELQDLNLPPAPEAGGDAPLLKDSASLDLHIVTSAASGYPGICTLENVKSALVRLERESRDKARREGRTDGSPSSSSSSAATNSSMKRRGVEEGGGSEEGAVDGSDSSGGSLLAAGCPNCLLYVLVAKRDPRCPRCGLHVPVPAFYKKPRVEF